MLVFLKKNLKFPFALFVILFLLPNSSVVFSLPIGMHYYIGEKVMEKLVGRLPANNRITEENVKSFLYGNVDADRGRFGLDKVTKKESDSGEFVHALFNLASTDDEKWYARGFKVHFWVDQQTEKFLESIFGKTEDFSYFNLYGTLDNYVMLKKLEYLDVTFLRKFNLDKILACLPKKYGGFIWKLKEWFFRIKLSYMGGVRGLVRKYCVNAKESCYIFPKHDDLLKRVYKKIANYNVGSEELEEGLANLIGASMILCVRARDAVIDEKFIKLVDEKLDELVDLIIKKICEDDDFFRKF